MDEHMNQQKGLHYSVCIDAVYRGIPLEQALADVHEKGFSKVECWTLNHRLEKGLPELLKKYHLELIGFCPDFFVLNDSSRHEQYLSALETALVNAEKLGSCSLITQVGADTSASRLLQHEAIVEGLKKAAPLLEKAGVTLVVEPLNTVKDHKGYYLSTSAEAFDIIDSVGSPNVKVLYDVYHQLHMGEDVQQVISAHRSQIGHFHIAGFPARDEKLFDGAFDYAPLLTWMRDQHLSQSIGLELFPSSVEKRDDILRQLADGI